MPHIACLSLLETPGEMTQSLQLCGSEVTWDVIPTVPRLETIRDQIRRLAGIYDAVCLDGLTSSFRIGRRLYHYEYIHNYLDLPGLGLKFSDGSRIRAIVERHLVKQAAETIKHEVIGKKILFLSGLNRYGSAEVLSGYSRQLIFGDLLYGYRLGIPINSFNAFVRSAPNLVRAVTNTPAQWYWHSVRTSRRFMPRFQYFFRKADVIVGGISYFERYAPASLEGKVIFTNLYRDSDKSLFESRNAQTLVSLTPVVQETRVPLPVFESALNLQSETKTTRDIGDYYINCLNRASLEPEIVHLGVEENRIQLAAAQLPAELPAPMQPKSINELELEQDGKAVKFCFVVHPLSFKQIKRLKVVRAASHFIPARLLEDAVARAPHFPIGSVINVTSLTGRKAEGILFGVPMTSKAIMRHPPEFMYRKLVQIARDAKGLGCRLMGLGAYTSVVGDAGLTVSKQSPIGVTSGNSFTVATTLNTLTSVAERCGIDLAQSNALVIGATGSIGSVCARMLAGRVKSMNLVSPRPEGLLELANKIKRETPSIRDAIRLSRELEDFLPEADIVISTTSAVDPLIDVTALKPGCVVCDVARPPDIREEEARKRRDVLVVESGEIQLPHGAEVTYDIGLPPGLVYACLAETILLALEGMYGHFTLGREIEPDKVELTAKLGEKHGLLPAAPHSFGEPVPESRFEELKAINRRRYGTPAG